MAEISRPEPCRRTASKCFADRLGHSDVWRTITQKLARWCAMLLAIGLILTSSVSSESGEVPEVSFAKTASDSLGDDG